MYSLVRVLVSGLLLLAACAQPVAPTGGPKDTTPPEVIRSVPENQSVNFSDDRVTLTFSEFISLKDINNQLMVSPPLSEQPDFQQRGKNLIMRFKEPLKDNTTYNFFFGDAIVDLTESNPLAAYNFTFSTGPVIDSLSLAGKVINAFTRQPVKGALVMLYDSIADSIPYTTRPYYVARTNDQGAFRLANLREGEYKMFALSDLNGNYLYDMPTEDIAFADSLVRPYDLSIFQGPSVGVRLPDSSVTGPVKADVAADSSNVADTIPVSGMVQVRDSLSPDTLKAAPLRKEPSYILYHFRESDTTQRLQKGTVLRQDVVALYFRQPVKSLQLRSLKPEMEGDWLLTAYNSRRDTVTLWVPNPVSDTLMLEVTANGRVQDTLYLSLIPPPPASARGQLAVPPKRKPTLTAGISANRIKPGLPLVITSSDPLVSLDTARIRFFADTLSLKPELTFADSLKMKLMLKYPWKAGVPYRLELKDSALVSIFGYPNDSTAFRFRALTEEETGSIKLIIKAGGNSNSYIVEMLGEKESVMARHVIYGDAEIDFPFLSPRKYRFRAIHDLNGNGMWDTGNYLQKKQAEPVSYFHKETELRANWTVEEEWQLD